LWIHFKLSNRVQVPGIWAGGMSGHSILFYLARYCESRECWNSSGIKVTKRYGRVGLIGKERAREGALFGFGKTCVKTRAVALSRNAFLHKIENENDDSRSAI
jgi:hypothetical protein